MLGGNILRRYRVEIDYADAATYWLQEARPDAHDLDQVGIMMRPMSGGKYFVATVATQKGRKTVDGVEPADRLMSVDGTAVTGRTMGQVLVALHGKPGERRTLVLERHGKQIVVKAPITSF